MKKIIVVFISVLFAYNLHAQVADSVKKSSKPGNSTVQGSTKYTYYPEENIYLNEASGQYSYYDPATSMWTSNTKLPSGYFINNKTPKSMVMYNGTDVWRENAAHQQKYGKTNTGSNPPKP